MIDKTKLQDPTLREELAQKLQQLTPGPWSMDINEQAHQLRTNIITPAAKIYKQDTFTPRRSYISNQAMYLIRLRRQIIQVVKHHHHGTDQPLRHFTKHFPK